MGKTNYSDSAYDARIHSASSNPKGFDAGFFDHDDKIRSGVIDAKVHEALDPGKLNSLGQNIRESLDSDISPETNSIVAIFDETGSMGGIPKIFVTKLGKLMEFLVKKDIVKNPQLMFGAFGDAKLDHEREVAPLQMGQFEVGNEMDDNLSKIYLEGSGGGQKRESAELVFYYLAKHTKLDCWDKRGEKALLFIFSDELFYPMVNREEVKRLIGDILEADIPTADILEELRERYEVIWGYPKEGSYFNDPDVIEPLKEIFGENFRVLEKAEDVCEFIAQVVGIHQGHDLYSVATTLKDLGADPKAVDRASKALVTYAGSRSKGMTKGTAEGDLVVAGKDQVTRL